MKMKYVWGNIKEKNLNKRNSQTADQISRMLLTGCRIKDIKRKSKTLKTPSRGLS